ncbi:MAG: hypothetical protein SOX77_03055 [Candidatus Borkfalkiaceae bacterium]|nr:hypothetical protein [Christensenellaceae bacterium]
MKIDQSFSVIEQSIKPEKETSFRKSFKGVPSISAFVSHNFAFGVIPSALNSLFVKI